MIKVTDEMIDVIDAFITQYSVDKRYANYRTVIHNIIELYEDNKSKSEPVATVEYSDDVISCDVCGVPVSYDVKHFSSSTNPHIHICDKCVEKYQYDRFFIDLEIEQTHGI